MSIGVFVNKISRTFDICKLYLSTKLSPIFIAIGTKRIKWKQQKGGESINTLSRSQKIICEKTIYAQLTPKP